MKIIIKAVSIALFMTVLIPVQAQDEDASASNLSGTVTTKGAPLKIREGKGTNTEIIATAKNGETVSVLGSFGEWYKVKVNDQIGYAHRNYIKVAKNNEVAGNDKKASGKVEETTTDESSSETTKGEWGTVATQSSTLLIRSGTNPSSDKVVARASKGDKVQILEQQGAWYKVQLENGTTGYASSKYVKKGTGEDSSNNKQERGNKKEASKTTSKAVKKETVMSRLDKASRGEFYGVVVTRGSPLNIRSGKGNDTEVVTKIEKGSQLRILDDSGEWYKVELENGDVGYAKSLFIKKVQGNKKADDSKADGSVGIGQYGIVVTKGSPLNIRMGKSREAEVITKADKGSKVKILEATEGWYKVELEDGTKGYAKQEFIGEE